MRAHTVSHAKNWDGIHDTDKRAAMRHWSRRPQLPVTAQMESDRALSLRISGNIDRLQELEKLDRRGHYFKKAFDRWPYTPRRGVDWVTK